MYAASNVIDQYGIQVSYTPEVCSLLCINQQIDFMHYKTLQHKYNLATTNHFFQSNLWLNELFTALIITYILYPSQEMN